MAVAVLHQVGAVVDRGFVGGQSGAARFEATWRRRSPLVQSARFVVRNCTFFLTRVTAEALSKARWFFITPESTIAMPMPLPP
ncbi:MAG: hypothetical protein HC777_02495 [Hyphomonadaceae bacterium]|nr:hypothetical protein [Hyphomonadaceae bacterium]